SAAFYLVCGAGGQAALTGKTMKDMGFSNVTNIGGFPAWKDAGGPTEA
ncbi:MAG: rhodanese-related sulfurtransferase, partial [Yoonia sp.]